LATSPGRALRAEPPDEQRDKREKEAARRRAARAEQRGEDKAALQSLEGKELVGRNPDSKARAGISAPGGGGSVQMFDGNGKQRFSVKAVKGGTALSLSDEEQKGGFSALSSAKSGTTVRLDGGAEQPAVHLMAGKNFGLLRVRDPRSKAAVLLSAEDAK